MTDEVSSDNMEARAVSCRSFVVVPRRTVSFRGSSGSVPMMRLRIRSNPIPSTPTISVPKIFITSTITSPTTSPCFSAFPPGVILVTNTWLATPLSSSGRDLARLSSTVHPRGVCWTTSKVSVVISDGIGTNMSLTTSIPKGNVSTSAMSPEVFSPEYKGSREMENSATFLCLFSIGRGRVFSNDGEMKACVAAHRKNTTGRHLGVGVIFFTDNKS
mmetsp:Transcript_109/g.235  ORF Transcript_109/g.235 Transcript_109/m.235 type:complete len:216 (-) Transcript_109:176-823(-)